MHLTTAQIASLTNGEIEGDLPSYVDSVAGLEEAGPSSLSFLANPKYEEQLYTSMAGVVLVGNDFEPRKKTPGLIRVEDPYAAFAMVLEEFERVFALKKEGVEHPVHIDSTAKVGKQTYLGAFSYLSEKVVIGEHTKIYPQVYLGENVHIGKHCVLFPGVKVYANCRIGDYCTLEAGAVIGSEGFGFVPREDGKMKRIPQIGNVILQDHVTVGANTTIDRATTGSTRIAKGVKLDNLVHLGHNVEIGENTAIAAQAGIAGSTIIGENCRFGGQVGIVGHLQIPNRTQIAPKGGVMSGFKEEGKVLLGAPAMDFTLTKKIWVIWRKLPELQRKIEQLEALAVDKSKEV